MFWALVPSFQRFIYTTGLHYTVAVYKLALVPKMIYDPKVVIRMRFSGYGKAVGCKNATQNRTYKWTLKF